MSNSVRNQGTNPEIFSGLAQIQSVLDCYSRSDRIRILELAAAPLQRRVVPMGIPIGMPTRPPTSPRSRSPQKKGKKKDNNPSHSPVVKKVPNKGSSKQPKGKPAKPVPLPSFDRGDETYQSLNKERTIVVSKLKKLNPDNSLGSQQEKASLLSTLRNTESRIAARKRELQSVNPRPPPDLSGARLGKWLVSRGDRVLSNVPKSIRAYVKRASVPIGQRSRESICFRKEISFLRELYKRRALYRYFRPKSMRFFLIRFFPRVVGPVSRILPFLNKEMKEAYTRLRATLLSRQTAAGKKCRGFPTFNQLQKMVKQPFGWLPFFCVISILITQLRAYIVTIVKE
jgi:hypothetical protein